MHIAPLAQQKWLLDLHRAPSWGENKEACYWETGTNSLAHGRKEKWETLTAPDIAKNTEENQISLMGTDGKHKTPMRASGKKPHELPGL